MVKMVRQETVGTSFWVAPLFVLSSTLTQAREYFLTGFSNILRKLRFLPSDLTKTVTFLAKARPFKSGFCLKVAAVCGPIWLRVEKTLAKVHGTVRHNFLGQNMETSI